MPRHFRTIPTTAMTLMTVPLLLFGATGTLHAQDEGGADAEAAGVAADTAAAVEAASAAALEWLAVVDSGDYEASWEQAAPAMRQAVTTAQWTAALGQARGPLEPFGERNRIEARYATELPGAPEGEYVVLQYRTGVAGDRTVVETVVPMNVDGAWMVSGYFVRPE